LGYVSIEHALGVIAMGTFDEKTFFSQFNTLKSSQLAISNKKY